MIGNKMYILLSVSGRDEKLIHKYFWRSKQFITSILKSFFASLKVSEDHKVQKEYQEVFVSLQLGTKVLKGQKDLEDPKVIPEKMDLEDYLVAKESKEKTVWKSDFKIGTA